MLCNRSEPGPTLASRTSTEEWIIARRHTPTHDSALPLWNIHDELYDWHLTRLFIFLLLFVRLNVPI